MILKKMMLLSFICSVIFVGAVGFTHDANATYWYSNDFNVIACGEDGTGGYATLSAASTFTKYFADARKNSFMAVCLTAMSLQQKVNATYWASGGRIMELKLTPTAAD